MQAIFNQVIFGLIGEKLSWSDKEQPVIRASSGKIYVPTGAMILSEKI